MNSKLCFQKRTPKIPKYQLTLKICKYFQKIPLKVFENDKMSNDYNITKLVMNNNTKY